MRWLIITTIPSLFWGSFSSTDCNYILLSSEFMLLSSINISGLFFEWVSSNPFLFWISFDILMLNNILHIPSIDIYLNLLSDEYMKF